MSVQLRKKSDLWGHFTHLEAKKAKCLYCGQILSISSGNVSNLGRHMKSKHPTVSIVIQRQPHEEDGVVAEPPVVDLLQPPAQNVAPPPASASTPSTSGNVSFVNKQPSILAFANNTRPLPPKRTEKLDEQLLIMVAREYHPFSVVEDKEFKKFVQMLCPAYQLPTRKTLSNNLLDRVHRQVTEQAKNKIADALSVCLTTDGWTSDNQNSFIGVTAHFIVSSSSGAHIESILLGCIEYDDRHTGVNICEFLKSMMLEWKIDNRISAIVSDNAANVCLAVRLGNWCHIPCFAHTLNLCMQDALEEICETKSKVKRIVEFFTRSGPANKKLNDWQKQLDLPILKLKQDVSTRWNSTYDMLSRLVRVKEAVTATLAIERATLLLTPHDWAIIENVLPILKLFFDVTNEICSEKNVTLSKVIPMCKIMIQHLRSHQAHEIQEVASLTSTLTRVMERRFSNIESTYIYAESTLLDPRFKTRAFQSQSCLEKAIADLKQKIGNCVQAQTQPQIPTAEIPRPAPSAATPSIWDGFDSEVATLLTSEDPTAAAIIEVDKYLREPMLPRIQGNPLTWWHERRSIYPHLYQLAFERLHVVATSVPCERIFSKAGNIITEKRRRLTTNKVSKLLAVNCNAP
ncbi:hypothetical protein O0L34_g9489 [Tuta absoluta]|nr:hypothetical protein O0L34_g10124 [Tuta absoluta]KAJ2947715.1 hypothetical protein O0L34_g9489 [Tuta absoluta]